MLHILFRIQLCQTFAAAQPYIGFSRHVNQARGQEGPPGSFCEGHSEKRKRDEDSEGSCSSRSSSYTPSLKRLKTNEVTPIR